MPGIKRKAEVSTSTPSSSKHAASPSARSTPASASRKSKHATTYMDDSDNNDDFDDEEDLLDAALHGTGSAALPDAEDDDDDDDEEDSDDDEEAEADAASQDEIELASDQDDEDDDDDVDDDDEEEDDFDRIERSEVELMSDEDMDGGFEDLEGAEDDGTKVESSASASSSRKPTKSALYAIPTLAEVQGLKETGELFKNNVFKLKVDEMLPEVRPAFNKASALETVLRRLHQLFQALSPIEPLPVGEAMKSFQKRTSGSKVRIPFPDPAPKTDANYKLGFEKPSEMHLVGSWPLKSTAKRPEGVDVDIAAVMPSSLFQPKDYVNFRYFHKKAFYLAALAHAIQTAEDEYDIHLGVTASFGLVDADPRRPVLVLRPIHDKSETDFSKLKCTIRVHPSVEIDTFKPIHLGPLRSNVRVASANGEVSTDALSTATATPRYNAAILADSLHLPHLVYLHSIAQACPAFADACLLLKTWAFQRGFGSGGRLNPKHVHDADQDRRRLVAGTASLRFILTMILAHLLQGEEKKTGWSKRDTTNAGRSKLANSFSSYQLFRGVMDWLAKHDFRASPVFMKSMPEAGLASRSDKMPRQEFSQVFDRVFVDPSGMLNLFAFIPTGSIDLLHYEARRTFEMLNDPSSDHFDALFLQDRNAAPFTFDEVARINLPMSAAKASSKAEMNGNDTAVSASTPIQRADFGTSFQAAMTQVSTTASRALEGRAKLVALLHRATGGLASTWRLDGTRPSASNDAEIGLVLDGEQAWRMVEHGPSSQETEKAEQFRAFWGKMSELRRFKDGRVLESVVWPVTTQASRWAIPRRILSYALFRHHSIHESQIHFVSSHFESLLDIDTTLARIAHLVSTEEKGFTLVQSAFDQLSKDLRALESLPLSIISISPASAGLRGTSTFVPAPINIDLLGDRIPDSASYLPVHDIILTFEGSGKWPNELSAIQAMKAAFFERMCAEITNKMPGTTCRVAFDPHASSKMEDQCWLELILASGFAFRARVMHNREKLLLERILADRFESAGAKRRARKILLEWQARFETSTLHHSYIASMGHRFASFGGAVRLTKRWLASQMLSSAAVPEELIELVSAAAYLSPEEGAPASAVAGLLRILRLLANWRWKEEPLMVPIQAVIDSASTKDIYTFPTEKRSEVETHFTAARGSDPSMTHRAWFVATETDTEGLAFGRKGPVGGVADGIKKLARSAVRVLEEATYLTADQVLALFTPSLEHYDFLIHLDPAVLPRYSENVRADPTVWGAKRTKYANDAAATIQSSGTLLGPEPKPGFDSAEAFLTLLRELYSDSFRLYHDQHGGSVVGGLFNPSLDRERDFKVGLGFSSQPSDAGSKTQVKLNKPAIVAEIERLGEGLVQKVELRSA
ncbi:U3 small nucleolar RNA-associated protein 22 [Pseudozyma hubeiensis]|nr:U3 small nucleolar RNA-associated protein 22 [Pseudozyma hubeiensis]